MEIVLKNVAAGVISSMTKERSPPLTHPQNRCWRQKPSRFGEEFSEVLAPEYVNRMEELFDELSPLRKTPLRDRLR